MILIVGEPGSHPTNELKVGYHGSHHVFCGAIEPLVSLYKFILRLLYTIATLDRIRFPFRHKYAEPGDFSIYSCPSFG
jgi:hypothetical protein